MNWIFNYTRKGADVSDCGQYRYRLWRDWGPEKVKALWIMLNPSTADGYADDATIRRCVGFSHNWGCSGLTVVNLFALRATNPRELKEHSNPYGPRNRTVLRKALASRRKWKHVVAAWGASANNTLGHDTLSSFEIDLEELAHEKGAKLECLGVTKMGHPRHPLYVPKDRRLIPWP
jgi:hypothetical protein